MQDRLRSLSWRSRHLSIGFRWRIKLRRKDSQQIWKACQFAETRPNKVSLSCFLDSLIQDRHLLFSSHRKHNRLPLRPIWWRVRHTVYKGSFSRDDHWSSTWCLLALLHLKLSGSRCQASACNLKASNGHITLSTQNGRGHPESHRHPVWETAFILKKILYFMYFPISPLQSINSGMMISGVRAF